MLRIADEFDRHFSVDLLDHPFQVEGKDMGQLSRVRRIRHQSRIHPMRMVQRRLAFTAKEHSHTSLPWFLLAAIITGSGGLLLIIAFAIAIDSKAEGIREALIPVGGLLIATGCAPFFIGIVQHLEHSSPKVEQRCGFCRYYRPANGTYARGICTLNRIHPTLRTMSCEHYVYSERAMVRDRLSNAAHILNSTHES
jgi:hypothetical protein